MTQLRWMTAGESHGPSLTVIIDGVVAGLPLRAEDINAQLARRQKGYGRGGRMKIESDTVSIESGVRDGHTLGSPIALRIVNRDHENWIGRMGAAPFDAPPEPVTLPRPGHADLAGVQKYDRRDARDILERASARETAARTAAGAVARVLLAQCGIEVCSRVRAIGSVRDEQDVSVDELFSSRTRLEESSLRVLSESAEARMRDEILARSHAGDTAGGVIEVVARNVMVGLGSHVHWDRRLDGQIAQAMMSVQAIKAVSIGDGIAAASRPGSEVHDPIGHSGAPPEFTRSSNFAGGIEGGMSNGQPIVVFAFMKPIATLRRALLSAHLDSKEPAPAAHERSDVCAVPAAGVVLEAMLCLTLASALLEKFGGDSLRELSRNVASYLQQLRDY
ncbi:MAG: chorismate synthase [Deltaproteobacteria bacterium]|nr:chorismate synthase [Deltaproteobacteria bacterium]